MSKSISWMLIIATVAALYYSWTATLIMGIVDFIAFIVAFRTGSIPVGKPEIKYHDPFDNPFHNPYYTRGLKDPMSIGTYSIYNINRKK